MKSLSTPIGVDRAGAAGQGPRRPRHRLPPSELAATFPARWPRTCRGVWGGLGMQRRRVARAALAGMVIGTVGLATAVYAGPPPKYKVAEDVQRRPGAALEPAQRVQVLAQDRAARRESQHRRAGRLRHLRLELLHDGRDVHRCAGGSRGRELRQGEPGVGPRRFRIQHRGGLRRHDPAGGVGVGRVENNYCELSVSYDPAADPLSPVVTDACG